MKKLTNKQMNSLLENDRYPRSSRYDAAWVLQGWMGPNVLWLTEWLTHEMNLKPGMRVLDMGCGKALSSIFLAREYGVQVWANDLWVTATENRSRIEEAGLADRVFPMHAEAHDLPYADEFFDAIVSLDSYQYYGTDDLYLGSFVKLLKPGGQIGIVVPALVKDFENGIPEHLTRKQANGVSFWEPDCWCFHTAEWWRYHWAKTGLVKVARAALLPDGWKDWMQYEHACHVTGNLVFPSVEESLGWDGGEYIGLAGVIAVRSEVPA